MVYVGFSATNSWISKLIRWFTKSHVSHCFIAFEAFGRTWILEPSFNGMQLLPNERFAKDNDIKVLVRIPELGEHDVARAMDSLGLPYDYRGLIGMMFPILGRWLKRKMTNPLSDDNNLFCSEFVVLSLQEAGFPGAEELVARDMSPQDVLDFLVQHYKSKKPVDS